MQNGQCTTFVRVCLCDSAPHLYCAITAKHVIKLFVIISVHLVSLPDVSANFRRSHPYNGGLKICIFSTKIARCITQTIQDKDREGYVNTSKTNI